MAATSNLPAPQNVALLTQKLYDADSDIRYMSLNDLLTAFTSASLHFMTQDLNLCSKVVDGFLHTLHDPNGEVQNLSIKCIGPFVQKAHPDTLKPFIHKLANLNIDHTVDKTVATLAMRAVVVSLPKPSLNTPRTNDVRVAYDAISRVLIPRLVGYDAITTSEKPPNNRRQGLLQDDLAKSSDSNAVDVLVEIAKCFGSMLQPDEIKALQKVSMQVLETDRMGSVMRKKSVIAVSSLSHYFSDGLLSDVISHAIEGLTTPHLTPTKRKMYMNLFGSMARAIPAKFGPHLKTVASFVFAALSQEEVDEHMQIMEEDASRDPQSDEVREAALLALESFVACCSADMDQYGDDTVQAILRFLKYDPNVTPTEGDEDEDASQDEDDEFDLEEDFEEEQIADDDDDVSWKVRRCAAKAMFTLIYTKGRALVEATTVYEIVIRALIDRFQDREESVRLEILHTTSYLLQNTADREEHDARIPVEQSEAFFTQLPLGRKRRRGNSDVSMQDAVKVGRLTGSTSPQVQSPPSEGPLACLTRLSHDITKGLLKLIRSSTTPTKQASISTLRELVIACHGGASEHLNEIFSLVPDYMNISNTDGPSSISMINQHGSASGNSIQIEALSLASELAKTHSSTSIQPQLVKLIPAVSQASNSKSSRVACEALKTSEQFVKVVTPPRVAYANAKTSAQLDQLLSLLIRIISTRGADLSTRQQAITVLGTLVGRTQNPQGSKLLSKERSEEAYTLLYDVTKNETTRYAGIKAIDNLGRIASERHVMNRDWLSKICLELAAQLRKADRSLRGASLQALKTLIADRHGSAQLDQSTNKELLAMTLPLTTAGDAQLVAMSLLVLAAIAEDSTLKIVDKELIQNISALISSPVAASVLDQVCLLMESIGKCGDGQLVMQALLKDVSMKSPPAVVGKVIGVLLVSSTSNVGLRVEDLLKEVKTSQDNQRTCLALSILGETGLRSGSSSPVSADLFVSFFNRPYEVSLAAAIAFGRAAAGPSNARSYVPVILSRLKSKPEEQYLLLHATKELLQYNEDHRELLPFTPALWDAAVPASHLDTSKTIGAECLANIAMIEPRTYLSSLQALLSDKGQSVRGTAIVAWRDIFTSTDGSYNKYLRPLLIEVLTASMRDSHLENRRSALSTFNAALRNRPELIVPSLGQLVPLVLDQTYEDPALIHEVSMGPFRHKVDDGLEVRKGAYETLYSLFELQPSRIDVPLVYPRIIAGLTDDPAVRSLCNLMVIRLGRMSPEDTASRLEEIIARFRTVLGAQLKETAVKHEHEKNAESKRGVVKVSLELAKALPDGLAPSGAGSSLGGGGQNTKWMTYFQEMVRDHGLMVKELEREQLGKGRS